MPVAQLRPFEPGDVSILDAWSQEAPVEHCYLQNQLEKFGTTGFVAVGRPMRVGAYVRPARLVVPFGPAAAGAELARSLREVGVPLRYVVGRLDLVDALWQEIRGDLPAPMWVRHNTLYALPRGGLAAPAEGPGHGRLRRPSLADLPWLVNASARMDLEDRGVDMKAEDLDGLERYMVWLMGERLVFLWEDDAGRPVFKAQAACLGPLGALVEGVFTEPEARGRGVAGRALRAMSSELLERTPRLGLYVNTDNVAAVRLYESVGYRPVGAYRSVYFRQPAEFTPGASGPRP